METQNIPLKITAGRFVRAVRDFASSEVGWQAKGMCAGLVALLCGVNGLNVVNSYVGRHFMTAIADRNQAEFIRHALFYLGVFAASTDAHALYDAVLECGADGGWTWTADRDGRLAAADAPTNERGVSR
jgi:ABC-type uncharacterized transport system fused permease/ATPase subunit